MARTKIILRQDVENIGEAGDTVTVAGGYARNYLIPRGLAVRASKGALREAEVWRNSRVSRAVRAQKDVEELKARLEAQPISVTAQSGPDGRLFGSVTGAQVSEAIAASIGVEIDRHTIEFAEPVRHLGFHAATAKLGAETLANLTVEVVEG